MRDGVVEVAPGRYRETFGRYFEDFEIGHIYEHRPGRTITDADNVWFTLLTEFGKPLVCSPFTVALMVGMSVSDVSQKAVANLGWQDIRLTHPLFPGDTLYAESEVVDKRNSQSRPEQGVVTVRTTGKNQHGETVCTFARTMLIWKRGFGPMES
jgi:itaconyl-CoA hydratase